MSKLRGHEIKLESGKWVYSDDGLPVDKNWMKKPCGHCGLQFTKEGHDGCLGTLPHTMNACCGHGIEKDAYVQNLDGSLTSGIEAIKIIATMLHGEKHKHKKEVRLEMNIYQLNDEEWWAAETLEGAIDAACSETGLSPDEVADEPYQLSKEELNELVFTDDDGTQRTFAEQLQLLNPNEPCIFAVYVSRC
jgi:hypothetical protein